MPIADCAIDSWTAKPGGYSDGGGASLRDTGAECARRIPRPGDTAGCAAAAARRGPGARGGGPAPRTARRSGAMATADGALPWAAGTAAAVVGKPALA